MGFWRLETLKNAKISVAQAAGRRSDLNETKLALQRETGLTRG